jgi:hypothetical protein
MRVLSGLPPRKKATERSRIPTRMQDRPITRMPLGRQNQPPDGSRPLRRRYVARLP